MLFNNPSKISQTLELIAIGMASCYNARMDIKEFYASAVKMRNDDFYYRLRPFEVRGFISMIKLAHAVSEVQRRATDIARAEDASRAVQLRDQFLMTAALGEVVRYAMEIAHDYQVNPETLLEFAVEQMKAESENASENAAA